MEDHTTIIGLDAHKAEIYATIKYWSGEEVEGAKFANTPPALRKFCAKVAQANKKRG